LIEPSTASEPVDAHEQQHGFLQGAKNPLEATPNPNARSQQIDFIAIENEQVEPQQIDRALPEIEIPLVESSPSAMSQPGDFGPIPSEPDESKRLEAIQNPIDKPTSSTASEVVNLEQQHAVLWGPLEEPSPNTSSQPIDLDAIQNEQVEPQRIDRAVPAIEIPLEESSPSATSQPGDLGPRSSEQGESKRFEAIQIPIDTPRPSTASEPLDTAGHQHEVLGEAKIPPEEPSATSHPGDPSLTLSEQSEPKRFEEIQSPIDNPSPSTASEPVDTPEQQHEVLCKALEQPSRGITNQPADPGPSTNEHMVVSDTELPLERLNRNTARPADPGPPPNQPEDLIVSTLDVPVDKPSTDSQPMLQIGPLEIRTEQDEQKRIDMVLSEIRSILGGSPPIQKTTIEQRNAAAVVVSEIRGLSASRTVDDKAANPLNAHRVKQSELKASDPAFIEEVEALLGISTSSQSERFLKKN